MVDATVGANGGDVDADWQRRVVGRSLRNAAERSVDRGRSLIAAAAAVLERSNGADITVQDVADEAGQSLRTLYQYFESKDDLLLALFEEAMRTYARMIQRSVEDLSDPFERLAGTILAAARMPEFSGTGLERGLARLRLKLSEVEPDRVTQAQAAVAAVVRDAVDAAAAAGRVTVTDSDAATFILLALNSAYITAETLGTDAGLRRPDAVAVTAFSLRGLGATVDETELRAIESHLQFPEQTVPPAASRDGAKRQVRKPRG